jgi:hypothetical protein
MTLLTKLSNKQPLQHALVQAIGADTVVNKLDDVVSFLVNFMTESPDSIFCSVVRTSRCSEKSLLSLGRFEALRSSFKAPLVMPSNAKPWTPCLLSCILKSNDSYVH